MSDAGRQDDRSVSEDETVEVVVSVDDAHAGSLPEVADGLRALGMRVDGLMEELGTVTGSIKASDLERVRGLRGIADVERSREFQLPPPDSEVQ